MMHFSLLPDWNSIDSVRSAHAILEVMAIVFFIVLAALESVAKILEKQHKHEAAEVAEVIGLFFFAIAVIAEFHAYPYSRRLDTLSERTIVSLGNLAGTADAKARQAISDSEKAVMDSGQAEAVASGALTIAQGARTEATSLKDDVVSAHKEALESKRALDEYKAPRTLTDEQCGRIARTIQPFAGQEFDFTSYRDTPESLHIAERIAGVLASPPAGWKFVPAKNASFLLGGLTGVHIVVDPEASEKTKNAGQWLVAALTKEGISAELKRDTMSDNPTHNKINLIVGTKP
jgi:hypothetical protein